MEVTELPFLLLKFMRANFFILGRSSNDLPVVCCIEWKPLNVIKYVFHVLKTQL